MKRYEKIKYIVLVLIISLLSITACSNDKEETANTSQISKENDNSSSVPTAEPTPEPKNPNVLELSGFEYYENKDEEQQDVYLASLYSAKTADKDDIIDSITVLGISDDTITVDCVIRTGDNLDVVDNVEYSINHKIVALDKETLKLKKVIEVDGNKYFVEDKKEVFVLSSIEEYSKSGIIYDNDLNMIGEYNLSEYDSVFVNENGKTIYAIQNKKFVKYDVATGEISHININDSCIAEYICGVISANNTEYLMASVVFEDFESHQTVIDVDKGEILYICDDENGYSNVDNGTFYICKYEDMGTGKWMIPGDKDNQWEYKSKDDIITFSHIMLDNGDVMFTTVKEDVVIMEVYDSKQGKLIDSIQIKVPSSEINFEDYDGEIPSRLSVMDAPEYIDEDTLLVIINNVDMETRFYIWNLNEEYETQNIDVRKIEKGTYPSVEIVPTDITFHTSGELNSELLPLRERADEMEEKYGVDIYIGEECGGYAGGYSAAPYVGYENVEYALDKLEYALDKYPKGFFVQFNDEYNKGLHVYLAGELRGVADDVLDLAGGFKDTENSKIILYINCDFADMVESTFHHELSHAIDEKVINADLERDNPLLSDDEWEKFNPKSDMYTMTYDEYGFDDNYKYVYDIGMYDSLSDVYFIDSYAMTYPTEDRARLFEAIMGEAYTYIEFEKSPQLQEKITYYSECIRQTFDTTGWGDVHWERYNK